MSTLQTVPWAPTRLIEQEYCQQNGTKVLLAEVSLPLFLLHGVSGGLACRGRHRGLPSVPAVPRQRRGDTPKAFLKQVLKCWDEENP